MAAGTDLNTLAARPQFPFTKITVKETVEKRSRDYVWQGAVIANPSSVYGWEAEWLCTTLAARDELIQHYLDNRGLTFPWTNPEDSTVYQVRYDPEEAPEFSRLSPAESRVTLRLLPAVT